MFLKERTEQVDEEDLRRAQLYKYEDIA